MGDLNLDVAKKQEVPTYFYIYMYIYIYIYI